jgi:hypothetical protein
VWTNNGDNGERKGKDKIARNYCHCNHKEPAVINSWFQ